jgi:hypothetical protein
MQVDVLMFLFLTASTKARPLKIAASLLKITPCIVPTRTTMWYRLIFVRYIVSLLVSHYHFTVSTLPKNSGWEYVAAEQTDEGLHERICDTTCNPETGLL